MRFPYPIFTMAASDEKSLFIFAIVLEGNGNLLYGIRTQTFHDLHLVFKSKTAFLSVTLYPQHSVTESQGIKVHKVQKQFL